jgi:hypothetical protein
MFESSLFLIMCDPAGKIHNTCTFIFLSFYGNRKNERKLKTKEKSRLFFTVGY